MPVSFCKSCGAEIIWCKTANGKSMPVDLKPSPQGNVIVDHFGVAEVLRDLELENYRSDPDEIAEPSLHLSHFATCPNAKQHRKPHLKE